ncbi:winged helix-turn-helix transcriptional regulator [Jeotgalibaca arthritidis]
MENMILSGDCICPRFEKTFTILGKKWTGLIIEVLLVDNRRFKDISEQISGVSDRVLVERLKELEEEGIVLRTENEEGPIKVMYSLTEKGRSLEKVMAEIQTWADKWICVEA